MRFRRPPYLSTRVLSTPERLRPKDWISARRSPRSAVRRRRSAGAVLASWLLIVALAIAVIAPVGALFDVIGSVFWAAYTCVFSYLVASIIDRKPIISFATSVIVTTALLGFLYVPLKHSIDSTRASTPTAGTT